VTWRQSQKPHPLDLEEPNLAHQMDMHSDLEEPNKHFFEGKPLLYEGKQSWDMGLRERKTPCEEASATWSYNVIDKRLQYKYILEGYRREPTAMASIISIFTLHNETVNIWTHFGGFVVMGYLLEQTCFGRTYADLVDAGMSKNDWKIMCFFDCCCMLMFGFSAMYHLLRDQSVRADQTFIRFDHMGILFQVICCKHGLTHLKQALMHPSAQ
jgi:hypothetical protein